MTRSTAASTLDPVRMGSSPAVPAFDFASYFLGHVRGYGLIERRGGTVQRQFVVDFDGRMRGDRLELDEHFAFDDGEQLARAWSVRQTAPGRFDATAPDVDGVATGTTDGNTLRWRYVLRLALGQRQVRLDLDDRMLLLADGVLLSRVQMSKWGIGLASMTVSYRRLG
jgi:hypothetical protein